ncbi:MAG: hypothetical protein Q8Q41_04630, partial [bacterium]|nr:hypothetical protein [bacterium]
KSENNTASLRAEALNKELPYRQAQIETFKKEGVIPGDDQELLNALDKIQMGQVINADLPLQTYIENQMKVGATIESLRSRTQEHINLEQTLRERLKIAQLIKANSAIPLASPNTLVIQDFIAKGWSVDSIIENLQSSLEPINKNNLQRKDYKLALLRLKRIPQERQESFDQQADIKKQIDMIQIKQMKSQPNKRQSVLSHKSTFPELSESQIIDESKLGVSTLKEVQQYAKEMPFAKWESHRFNSSWEPDPKNEPCPEFRPNEPDVITADVVDLHKATPGTILHWNGSHPGAHYFLRIEPNGMIKVWRGGRPNEITGLIGKIDDIEMFDAKNVKTPNSVINYSGTLISKNVPDTQASATMPYFTYDKTGRVIKPSGAGWFDSVKNIYIKPPK